MDFFQIGDWSMERRLKMRDGLFTAVAVVVFVLMGQPSAAMMGGGHGHMQGYDSRDESRTDRWPPTQDRESTRVHWHGNYSHSHEGGEIPHSHDGVGRTRETPREQIAPAGESEPPGQQMTPRSKRKPASRKTLKKALPALAGKEAGSKAQETIPESHGLAPTPLPVAQPEAIPTDPLKSTIQARDEVAMHLVHPGTLTLPESVGASGAEPAKVDGFYMDETQVTNHQYVEFLNEVVSRIRVEKGVVRGDGEVWLFLGEVREGYEPIMYEEGRFRVKGVHHAACAVLRVTAHGASAYARFYGKRLPTESEWRYAVNVGAERPSRYPPIPSPVILYPANSTGIRGLDANLGEWGTRGSSSRNGGVQPEYLVLGGVSSRSTREGTYSPAIRRYPWEAFAEVSFRCVLDAPPAAGESEPPLAKEGDSP